MTKKRKTYRKLWARKNRENWKIKALNHLGGECKTCGENDHRCLQIDHVNNDGYLERVPRDPKYYKGVMADKTGKYQVLCANHNKIKQYEHRKAMQRNEE